MLKFNAITGEFLFSQEMEGETSQRYILDIIVGFNKEVVLVNILQMQGQTVFRIGEQSINFPAKDRSGISCVLNRNNNSFVLGY